MTVSGLAMLSVGEGDGMVQVCVILSAVEDTERNVNISLSTSDGTGNALKVSDILISPLLNLTSKFKAV